MTMKVGMISLGCAKNLVDSEMILGMLQSGGAEIVATPEVADLILINTCGFIQSAKEEAIRTIFEMVPYRTGSKKLVVLGCLSQRYQQDLSLEIPEVDRFVRLDEYGRLGEIIQEVMEIPAEKSLYPAMDFSRRLLSTPPHWAYVRIADGCDNCCTYCAIPLIRGSYHSRKITDIYEETKMLVQEGRKEIVLIAQDTTAFGKENGESLSKLLRVLSPIKGLMMLRVLYLYPHEVNDELIETFATLPNVAPYFDLPIQHADDNVLRRMNRRDTQDGLRNLLHRIRQRIPRAILRTTVMVGFPGESEQEFQNLLSFLKEMEFDRLGAFMYSPEEGTPASKFEDSVPTKEKQRRYQMVMRLQQSISSRRLRQQIGTEHEVMIEGYDSRLKQFRSRSFAFAGDQTDGWIYVNPTREFSVGEMLHVRIIGSYLYDLIAEVIEK
jgi:ribosomal protein S12 methylthiotransferase